MKNVALTEPKPLITEDQWSRIVAHLPPPAATGRPRNDEQWAIVAGLYMEVARPLGATLRNVCGQARAHAYGRSLRQLETIGAWEMIVEQARHEGILARIAQHRFDALAGPLTRIEQNALMQRLAELCGFDD